MSTGLELRTRHQSNLLSTCSLVSVRPRVATALEDKVLQRAVVEVLNAVYEQDFLGFSYGFRPGRTPHDALDAFSVGITRKKVNWVLDADVRDYFTSLDHSWLVKFLEHRIADRRVLRLIQKWLTAGVIEDGEWSAFRRDAARSVGFDAACERLPALRLRPVGPPVEERHARGDVVVVRFADDFVVGFEHRDDAERFWADLRDRFASSAWSCTPRRRG